MRRRASHQGEAADVNVTPLLDIVFIMLIFFIVTATFIREQGINASSPEDTPPPPGSVPPPAMVLSVREDGLVQIDGGRLIDPLSTKSVVQEFTAREPNGVVLVSAAPESESGIAVTVLDQARAGGARGRTSLTLQKEQ